MGGRLPAGLEGPRARGWDIETGHERVRDTHVHTKTQPRPQDAQVSSQPEKVWFTQKHNRYGSHVDKVAGFFFT